MLRFEEWRWRSEMLDVDDDNVVDGFHFMMIHFVSFASFSTSNSTTSFYNDAQYYNVTSNFVGLLVCFYRFDCFIRTSRQGRRLISLSVTKTIGVEEILRLRRDRNNITHCIIIIISHHLSTISQIFICFCQMWLGSRVKYLWNCVYWTG